MLSIEKAPLGIEEAKTGRMRVLGEPGQGELSGAAEKWCLRDVIMADIMGILECT